MLTNVNTGRYEEERTEAEDGSCEGGREMGEMGVGSQSPLLGEIW